MTDYNYNEHLLLYKMLQNRDLGPKFNGKKLNQYSNMIEDHILWNNRLYFVFMVQSFLNKRIDPMSFTGLLQHFSSEVSLEADKVESELEIRKNELINFSPHIHEKAFRLFVTDLKNKTFCHHDSLPDKILYNLIEESFFKFQKSLEFEDF